MSRTRIKECRLDCCSHTAAFVWESHWARRVLEAMFLEKKGFLGFVWGKGQVCVNLCIVLFFCGLKGWFFLGRRTEDCIVCVCNLFTWIGSKTSKCSSQCGIGTQQSMSHWANCVANNQKPAVCLCEAVCKNDGTLSSPSLCFFLTVMGKFYTPCINAVQFSQYMYHVSRFQNYVQVFALWDKVAKAWEVWGVILQQRIDINLPLQPDMVRRKKKINGPHYLSSLWHITLIILYKTANLRSVSWEAELRLHRLTATQWTKSHYLTSPQCLISHRC